MARVFFNPAAKLAVDGPEPTREPMWFHERLPGYAPTPLVAASNLAERLGLGKVWVKDESNRLGLPAFKILGASWATYRAAIERLGREPGRWSTLQGLAAQFAPLQPLTLVTATDGNHGRAVARVAALLGFEARVFVPRSAAPARIQAIESEGARVSVVEGSYDEAVERAAAEAGPNCLVISDTSWQGYEQIPRWVIEGYSTIFWEVHDALAAWGEAAADLVVVQAGVGGLASAAVRHYRRRGRKAAPRIVAVEPERADCLLASVEAGRIVSLPGPHDSIMAGLNCGTPSLVAWPLIRDGIDCFVAMGDEGAYEGMRELARAGLVSGAAGASGAGGLIELLAGDQAGGARERLGVTGQTRVLLISTEGATDPAAYGRIVGHL